VPPVRVGGPVASIFLYEDGTCAVMETGTLRCWGYNGGILGYPFSENIGRNEHPETAGDIQLFPGPVTGGAASVLAADHAGPSAEFVPSVVVVPVNFVKGGGFSWAGPLAGRGGVILPDSS